LRSFKLDSFVKAIDSLSQKNNDIIFTAADIEKYHKGLMSYKERHALEKAALDDPFLAEALEGYSAAPVNVNEEIDELKRRLAIRTEKNKSIKLPFPFPLWKIAAMIVLVAGAGLLVYQLGFNSKNTEIAQAKRKIPVTTDSSEQNKTISDTAGTPTFDSSSKDVALQLPATDLYDRKKDQSSTSTSPGGTATDISVDANAVKEEPVKVLIEPAAPPIAFPPAIADDKTDQAQRSLRNDNAVDKNSTAKSAEFKANELSLKKKADSNAGGVPDRFDGNAVTKTAAKNERLNNLEGFAQYKAANVFRGRVTDAHNNALPFTNITNLDDNVGTYSDARGYFNLTSPDSVLNVQVRSLGFESNNVQLRNYLPENKVLLEEDRSLSARILDTVKRNTNRQRNNTMILDEPEPVDGWSNYDTYLVNNLKVPEAFRTKQSVSGEVELSFDVNKNGEPVNITVKKSLCESCDKEAIRLIKEGPKWKRKIKKGKARVTVSF
jgi:CarboxypepD_reg-like domain/Gram-negative bacterial TonB protein C-terminal